MHRPQARLYSGPHCAGGFWWPRRFRLVFTASPLHRPRPFFHPPVHPAPPPCSYPGPVMVSRSARGRPLIHGFTPPPTALPPPISPTNPTPPPPPPPPVRPRGRSWFHDQPGVDL